MWWYIASSFGQAPAKPTYGKPAGQSSGFGSYSRSPGLFYGSGSRTSVDDDPSVNVELQYGDDIDDIDDTDGDDSQYGASEAGPAEFPDSSPPQSDTWSLQSDTTSEDKPVITLVDDEDQVYAYKSRTSYNQKRLLFSQFRYTPTKPLEPEEPVFSHKGKD